MELTTDHFAGRQLGAVSSIVALVGIASVQQVEIAEFIEVVSRAMLVIVGGVLAPKSTWLDEGIAVGADHKRRGVVVVETISGAFT